MIIIIMVIDAIDAAIDRKTRLIVTQIGKECHTRCKIYNQTSNCTIPRKGVAVRALSGGRLKIGDKIDVSFV